MKKYGVMLIGCGHIGMEHLLDIYYRDNVNVIAICDADIERARVAAARAGGVLYGTDYREFLSRSEIDIVIIATYTNSHLAILKDCLNAGKHVLCEKPLATTLEDGYEFLKAVEESDRKVLIAHILRRNSSYRMIKDLISNGAIGEIRLIRMTQNHHAMNWPRYQRLMEDCSPTVDCGVHYYDVAEWVTGAKITEVTGFGTKTQPDTPRENYTMVNYKMSNGCIGYYEAGWGETLRSSNNKEFIGTEGRITLEMRDRRSADTEEGDLITLYRKDGSRYETLNVNAVYKDMYAQLEVLIDMIENGSVGEPTMQEAWRAFRTSLAAEESIVTGKTIYIDP